MSVSRFFKKYPLQPSWWWALSGEGRSQDFNCGCKKRLRRGLIADLGVCLRGTDQCITDNGSTVAALSFEDVERLYIVADGLLKTTRPQIDCGRLEEVHADITSLLTTVL